MRKLWATVAAAVLIVAAGAAHATTIVTVDFTVDFGFPTSGVQGDLDVATAYDLGPVPTFSGSWTYDLDATLDALSMGNRGYKPPVLSFDATIGDQTFDLSSLYLPGSGPAVDSVGYPVAWGLAFSNMAGFVGAIGNNSVRLYAPGIVDQLQCAGCVAENVIGVPEPANWALLVTGFGLAGASLRRRRALT